MSEYLPKFQIGDRVLIETRHSKYVEGAVIHVIPDASLRHVLYGEYDTFYKVRFASFWRRTRWMSGSEVRGLIGSEPKSAAVPEDPKEEA